MLFASVGEAVFVLALEFGLFCFVGVDVKVCFETVFCDNDGDLCFALDGSCLFDEASVEEFDAKAGEEARFWLYFGEEGGDVVCVERSFFSDGGGVAAPHDHHVGFLACCGEAVIVGGVADVGDAVVLGCEAKSYCARCFSFERDRLYVDVVDADAVYFIEEDDSFDVAFAFFEEEALRVGFVACVLGADNDAKAIEPAVGHAEDDGVCVIGVDEGVLADEDADVFS